MAKKKQTKKIKKVSPEERFLLILIEASEKAVTSQGTGVDEFFRQQANRLRGQLKALRGSK